MAEEQIRSAFVYAYPLYAFAATRFAAVQNPANADRYPPNSLRHNRHLSDHASVWITAPNNDTLYSNAWLDLSSGPVRIRVGAMPEGRYWSLAFMDAFTNHFAVVGQRLEGTGPVDLCVVGPGDADQADGARVLQAPGHDAWLFCRCLVDGPDDLARSHAMQDKIEILSGAGEVSGARIVPASPVSPENFLDVVNELLARNPVPAGERQMLEQWRSVGLRPGGPGAWNEIGSDIREAWTRTIGSIYADLGKAGQQGRQDFKGWMAAAADIGNFGDNYPLRASVALGGLGALEPVEAMYFVKYQDESRAPLDGQSRYLLKVPASGIPTDSFWSFTMYEATADGKRFLVENPIGRYSIGNRTPGLVYNADGSLDIALQRQPPDDPQLRANWLPTPAGAFQIALRTYVPRPDLRAGEATLPVVIPVQA
ncbi:DUF1254 domain-containing protein [Zhengella mangrovi]|nr:DUF1254 domain-containing protein [Zhengella mangrovi]